MSTSPSQKEAAEDYIRRTASLENMIYTDTDQIFTIGQETAQTIVVGTHTEYKGPARILVGSACRQLIVTKDDAPSVTIAQEWTDRYGRKEEKIRTYPFEDIGLLLSINLAKFLVDKGHDQYARFITL